LWWKLTPLVLSKPTILMPICESWVRIILKYFLPKSQNLRLKNLVTRPELVEGIRGSAFSLCGQNFFILKNWQLEIEI